MEGPSVVSLSPLLARVRAAFWRHSRALTAIMVCALVIGAALSYATWDMSRDERLGTLNFPVSCGWQSQREFTRATSLLHLFRFAEAEAAYDTIIDRDPDCAIAYWGVAMSRLQNPLYALPTEHDVDVARKALALAAAAPIASARERAYLHATRLLFSETSSDWPSRLATYAQAMKELAGEFPHDREATIFYALALNLDGTPTDKARSKRTKAAELLLEAFSDEPNHPGISHYLTFCLGHAAYQPKPFQENNMPKPAPRVLWGTLALLALLGLGAFVALTSDLRSGASSGTGIGGPFVLTAADGKAITDRTFRGQSLLIYFGYAHCPDVCPTTLLAISQALEELGPLASKVQPIFISLDPKRDTPQIIGEFTKSFDPKILGLTGSIEEVAMVAKQFRVFYKKRPIEGSEDYLIEHSSYIYVIDPDGHYVTVFSHDETEMPKEMARRLEQLLISSQTQHGDTNAADYFATKVTATSHD